MPDITPLIVAIVCFAVALIALPFLRQPVQGVLEEAEPEQATMIEQDGVWMEAHSFSTTPVPAESPANHASIDPLSDVQRAIAPVA